MFKDDLHFLRMRANTMFILNCYSNSGLARRALCWLAWALGERREDGALRATTLSSLLIFLSHSAASNCSSDSFPAVKFPHQCCDGTSKSSIPLVSAQVPQRPCQGAEQHQVTGEGSTGSPVPCTVVKAYTHLFS